MGRSVVASEAGIVRAKQALKRQNLTQKAFSREIGLSWSTVNNFFNKKPIFRTNFEEICRFLDLDWQDIVEPFVEDEETQQLNPLEELWRELQMLGSPTEEMGLVLAQEETLDWGWKAPIRYEKSVRVGSYIRFEVNFSTPGYLLLLQKNTSGQVWCFCPSCFAPQPHLDTGKTTLPQEGSPLTSFPIEGTPGEECIVAVITKKVPTLDWLPQGSDEPLQMEERHLMQLLEYISEINDCEVLYTTYAIAL
jgi:DNA-binding Xre family transcriptional regulator